MTEYRNPKPTVDIVIVDDTHCCVVIKRKNPPYGWALPGGFVNEGKSYEDAAVREAKEETSLDVILMEQFYTYSDPNRDPRQHNASTVFIARIRGDSHQLRAADDATEAVWVDIYAQTQSGVLELAFDHQRILEDVALYLTEGVRPKITR
jgi:8-oxo-dGTP diphosphatase